LGGNLPAHLTASLGDGMNVDVRLAVAQLVQFCPGGREDRHLRWPELPSSIPGNLWAMFTKTGLFRCIIFILLAPSVASRAQFLFTSNTDGTLNLSQYIGPGGAVTVPDTTNGLRITSIGNDAFFRAFGLTSLTFGTNVVSIGTNAVFQCINLVSVTIPASVTNIGMGPFVDCQKLTTLSLSASNSSFAVTNGALFNKDLTSLIQYPGGLGGSYTVSALVTNVGEAFIGNTLAAITVDPSNLYYSSTNGVLFDKSQTLLIDYPGALAGPYTVPHSVTAIESAAFEYSSGVTRITIDTNVINIGPFAFYDCAGLAGIAVSSTNAYYSSTNGVLFDKAITTLIQYPCAVSGSYTVPGTVTNIMDGAFGDAFGLTDVVMANSVTSIGVEAFYGCLNLAAVSLGNQVASIGEQAFFQCTNLTHLAIPDSTTDIAQYAFYYCSALTSVTFGSGIHQIGFEAFAGCQNLKQVCFSGNAPVDGGSIFYFDERLAAIDYVMSASGWGLTYDGIPTSPVSTCGAAAPRLGISQSGPDVELTWPATTPGYTLQSTTNFNSPSDWTSVLPEPVIVNSNYTVTDAMGRPPRFYRLMGP
jgi:hypothetical protein